MCTVCGCGKGEVRIEGEEHEHVGADGTVYRHVHSHGYGLGGHSHGHVHAHQHEHQHEHSHEHGHEDGTVHSHPHAHAHSHEHPHEHDHAEAGPEHGHGQLHPDGASHGHVHPEAELHAGAPGHEHAHGHGHEHQHEHTHQHEHSHWHEDGTVHSHPHGHGHSHAHEHQHSHGQDGAGHGHGELHGAGAAHEHSHGEAGLHADDAPHRHGHDLHYGLGPAHAHAPGLSQERMVRIEQDILGKNDALAAENRRRLAEAGVFAINLVSSPGSGKTSLLVKTIEALRGELPVSVVEGDQQTSNDADRIRATGAPAIQVNTGKGCHLDAEMVRQALERLKPGAGSLLMIENVGNLVCPAAFDLGEAHKVVILSVTEGEDKPLKYPDMFHAADLMLLSKVDLLPYLGFDVDKCVDYARRINPRLTVLPVSAVSGEGMAAWLDWLRAGVAAAGR